MASNTKEYEISGYLIDEMIRIRHDLHRNPELSGKEYRTTAVIREFLERNGIRILPFPLETGLVAEIGEGNKIVALRADIDALPISEMTGLSYESGNEGVMHACGHDFHTVALMGAAVILKEREKDLKGKVRLIFQPAEEINAGAKEVIKKGVLEGVCAIAGFHNKPDMPVGTVGIKEGSLMAAVDRFYVEIKGTGTHAAAPHNGSDPVVTASHIVSAVQAIVSRHISPLDTAIISVTRIEAGNTWNVIPEKVIMEGTIRTFSKHVQEKIKGLFAHIVLNYAQAFNQEGSVSWEDEHNPVNNDKRLSKVISEKMNDFAEVIEPEITTGGEDFSFYQEKVPGLFAFIGTGSPYEWHNPRFLIDDGALYYAIRYYIVAADSILAEFS